MFSKIWNWIKSFFTKDNVGAVFSAIFTATKSAIASLITDSDVQAKALSLVKTLASSDLTSDQKKEAFNEQMKTWLTSVGKDVGSSTLSTVRELALSAAKIEQGE